MDCKIKLSIIIPVYNTSKYLSKCLESVKSAIDKIDDLTEVIVINDGSTDCSEEIILPFCRDRRFTYYKKENGGLSDTKNYGMERAAGEYIIFLDSDDFIEENMYAEMLSRLKEEHADIVVCDMNLVFEDGSPDRRCPCNTLSRDNVFWQIIDTPMMATSCNKIVKKALYNGLAFPIGLNNEDVAVTPIVLGRAEKICVCNNVAYNYLQRKGSIQNSSFSEKRFVLIDAVKLCSDRMSELDIQKQKQIQGSVYFHQVLALAMYSIREQKFGARYRLLKKYMYLVEKKLPDFWYTDELYEFCMQKNLITKLYKKFAVYLLKHRLYFIASIYFQMFNCLTGE